MHMEEVIVTFKTTSGKVVAKGYIRRSWIPLNFQSLVSSLPLTSTLFFMGKDLAYLPLTLSLRVEKRAPRLSRGDIVLLPSAKSIGIVLKEGAKPPYHAVLAGKVEEGLEILEKLPKGSVIIVERGA